MRYPIKRLARLFRRYVLIDFRTESEFRTDFLAGIVQQLLHSALLIIFWDALFRLTGALPGWSLGDVAMMTGLGQVSQAIFGFFLGLSRLSDRILRGELDRYLTKPVPPVLCLALEGIALRPAVLSAISGLLIIALAVLRLGYRIDPLGMLIGLLLMLIGRLIYELAGGAVALLVFWIGRTQALARLLGEMDRFSRYPVFLFDRPLRFVLTWVWPVGLYLTYPVLLARGELEGAAMLLTGAVAVLIAWVGVLVLMVRRGLRRYESYGG